MNNNFEIQEFHHFEELIEAFQSETNLKFSFYSQDKRKLLNAFHLSLKEPEINKINPDFYAVYPDPHYNFCFLCAGDDVELLRQEFEGDPEFLKTLDISYDIPKELLTRSYHKLSAGEALILAYYKAHLYEPKVERLIICNPTQWLHASKKHLLQLLVDYYIQKGKKVKIYRYQGEHLEFLTDNDEAFQDDFLRYNRQSISINWLLKVKTIKVELSNILMDGKELTKTLIYESDPQIPLMSPTILTGINGIGKSIFCRILCGLIPIEDGEAKVIVNGFEGKSRMVFQKSQMQLFGDSINYHFARVFRFDTDKKSEAQKIYEEMISSFRLLVSTDQLLSTKSLIVEDEIQPPSLLQVKFALLAERIVSKPALIILDEPEWGFSRKVNDLFVKTILEVLFKNSISVLIISHLENWYKEFSNSILSLSRTGDKITIKRTDD